MRSRWLVRLGATLGASLLRAAFPLAMTFAPPASASVPEPPRVVLVLPPQGGDPITEQVLAALRAQLGDVMVRLVVETAPRPARDLRAHIDFAVGFAKNHDALGAFWLDVDGAGDLLLFLVKPEGTRVLMRRVRGSSPAAGIEEVAVIFRASTEALLQGREIGMEPIESPARETPGGADGEGTGRGHDAPGTEGAGAPEGPPQPWRARLALGYVASTFARASPATLAGDRANWLDGVSFTAEAGWSDAMYGGFAYHRYGAVVIGIPEIWAAFSRNPLSAFLGYRPVDIAGGIDVALEAGATADYIARSVLARVPSVVVVDSGGSWTFAALARLRVTFGGLPARGYVRAGLEGMLRNVEYVVAFPDEVAFLSPTPVRFTLEIGVSIPVL